METVTKFENVKNMLDALLKTKYEIIFVKKLNEGYNEIGEPKTVYDYAGKTRINPLLSEKIFKGHPLKYNMTEVSYRKGNKAYIFKDIDNGQTVMKLGSDNWEVPQDSKFNLTKIQLIKEGLNNSSQANYGLLILIIVGVMGLLGGLLLGMNIPAITGAINGAV